MLELDGQIIGYTAFEVHKDNSLHVFSIEVEEQYRKNRLAISMIEEIIRQAVKKGIKRIRIGAGRNKYTNKLYQFIASQQRPDIVAGQGNWLEIK